MEHPKKLYVVEGYEDLESGKRSKFTAKFAFNIYISRVVLKNPYSLLLDTYILDLSNMIEKITTKFLKVENCDCDQESIYKSACSIVGVAAPNSFCIIYTQK